MFDSSREDQAAQEIIMTEDLAVVVRRLYAGNQAALARAKARSDAMARHAKPERLAAATIKTMDPER
jgi:hypothetical protein